MKKSEKSEMSMAVEAMDISTVSLESTDAIASARWAFGKDAVLAEIQRRASEARKAAEAAEAEAAELRELQDAAQAAGLMSSQPTRTPSDITSILMAHQTQGKALSAVAMAVTGHGRIRTDYTDADKRNIVEAIVTAMSNRPATEFPFIGRSRDPKNEFIVGGNVVRSNIKARVNSHFGGNAMYIADPDK